MASREQVSETLKAPILIYLGAGLCGAGFGILSGFATVALIGQSPLNIVVYVVIYTIGSVSAFAGIGILNNSQLDTNINSEGIEIKQGVFSRKLKWKEIKGAAPEDSELTVLSLSYWKRVFKGQIWKIPGVPSGVVVSTESKGQISSVYISTMKQHELIDALKQKQSEA